MIIIITFLLNTYENEPEHKRIIADIHNLAHSGKQRTMAKTEVLCWWPDMLKHISDYIESCNSSQVQAQKPTEIRLKGLTT